MIGCVSFLCLIRRRQVDAEVTLLDRQLDRFPASRRTTASISSMFRSSTAIALLTSNVEQIYLYKPRTELCKPAAVPATSPKAERSRFFSLYKRIHLDRVTCMLQHGARRRHALHFPERTCTLRTLACFEQVEQGFTMTSPDS